MNYKLAKEEFQRFDTEVGRLSYTYPINEVKLQAALDKCQNMIDTLYSLVPQSFGIQLTQIKFRSGQNLGGDKLSSLKGLVTNILDDIRMRELAEKERSRIEIESERSEKHVYLERLSNALDSSRQEAADLSSELEIAKSEVDTLRSEHAASLKSVARLKKTKIWLVGAIVATLSLLNFMFSTNASLTIDNFSLSAFLMIEAAILIAVFVYVYRRLPKLLGAFTLITLIGLLVVVLVQQEQWKEQLLTAMWSLAGGLVIALVGYILDWNKPR
jgi:hypothetical protein